MKVSPSILHMLSLRTEGITPGEGWAIGTAATDINAEGLQVHIDLEEFTQGFLAQLQGRGAIVETVAPDHRLIQARIPLDRIEQVSQLRFIRTIRIPDYGVSNQQGAVGTEGDGVMRTSMVRQYLGVTGGGIRVGVISGGIRGLS